MISEIVLKNFRPHESLKLRDLHPNLNVIIGDTGTGKTSIFRALRLLFNNEPAGGTKLYKFKEKTDLLIQSIVKGIRLTRKAKSYNIQKGKKDLTLTAFGKSVPEPIINVIDLKDINWQLQIQPPFLILDNGGTVARYLNPILGSDESDLIIKEIKKQVEEFRAQIRALNMIVSENEKTIKQYGSIPGFKERVDELQEHLYLLQGLDSQNFLVLEKLNSVLEIESQIIDQDKLEDIIEKISKIESEYKKVEKRNKVILEIEANLNRLKKIEEKYTDISIEDFIEDIIKIEKKKTKEISVQEEIYRVESLLKSWKNIDDELEIGVEKHSKLIAKWEKELSKLEICPFCNQEIKNVKGHIHNRPTYIRKKSNLQIR